MELKKLQSKLNDSFENSDFKRIFEILKVELDEDCKKRSSFLLLKQRYNKNSESELAGVSVGDQPNIIARDLLNFIKSIEQPDLSSKPHSSYRETPNYILVLTRSESLTTLRDFFLQLNFINVKVEALDAQRSKLDDFDLIIFDNQDLPDSPNQGMVTKFDIAEQQIIENRIDGMEAVLKASSKIIIHFGNRLYWVNSNRDRVQAANSQFSLHARTKEVIDFINTYRV